MAADDGEERTGRVRWPLAALAVALMLGALGGCWWLLQTLFAPAHPISSVEDAGAVEPVDEGAKGDELVQNPIDFAGLKSECADVVAWLYIPGLEISLPVVQSPTDDSFYLDHDTSGAWDPNGTPFIQLANAPDFSDAVTVVYGHRSEPVFDGLHAYEDAAYLVEHPTIYLYTPGHIYTYEIVSAYQYDNRHILNTFDFTNEQVREDYFAEVMNPTSMVRSVNEGVALEPDSKLLQLSTCNVQNRLETRYIVSAVRVDDQETY